MQSRIGNLSCYWRMLRFDSWMGWLFNFALGSIFFTLPPFDGFVFASFSLILATAGIFILNQYFDRENDKLNDLKRDLPIASGNVSPRVAFSFFVGFTFLSVCFVLSTNLSLLPLFLVYIGLWTCYSAPPLSLKGRPIIDVIVAGFGAGVLPFIIGLQVSNSLTLDLSLPWIRRRYQDAFLSVLPLLFFHGATQIFQSVGDYEADLEGNIQTFAVKYGKKLSMKWGMLLLVVCVLLPIFYGFFDLSLNSFLGWYLVVLVCCIPGAIYVVNLLKGASKDKICILRQISRKVGPAILGLVWVYALLIRVSLS